MKATKLYDKVDAFIEKVFFVGAIIFLIAMLIHGRDKFEAIFKEIKDLTYSVEVFNESLPVIAMQKGDPVVLEHIEDLRTDEERRIDKFTRYSKQIGEELDVDPYLILAIIEVESHYNPDIYGNGAIGLMQVIPSCHVNTMNEYGYSRDDLYDPYKNIRVGAKYLSTLTHKYEDISFALVCYNKGEGGALASGVRSTGYSQHVLSVYNRMTGGDIS